MVRLAGSVDMSPVGLQAFRLVRTSGKLRMRQIAHRV